MFLFFSLTQQSENVSVLEQSIQTCIKIFFLSLSRSFFKMFVLKHQFCFVFVFGNGKEWRRNPLLGWRKQCWELHCEETPLISSVEVSTSLSLLEGKELISQTEEGDFISRWISDRPFSNDRLCTTCLSSPCRTPFGTSSPPHGVSLVTADVTA